MKGRNGLGQLKELPDKKVNFVQNVLCREDALSTHIVHAKRNIKVKQ